MDETPVVSAVRSPDAVTPILEARLRALLDHVGLHPDLLVGSVWHVHDLTGAPDIPPIRVRSCVWPRGGERGRLSRRFLLHPYDVELLMDDARHAGPGARLEVVVDRRTPASVSDTLRRRLASLSYDGVQVVVRVERDHRRRSRPGTAAVGGQT